MPDSINSRAVAALRGQAGLPITAGVPSNAELSPSSGGAQPVEPKGTPAAQELEASQILAQIEQESASPEPSSVERVVEAKDAAIAAAEDRIRKLEQLQQNNAENVQQLLSVLSTSKQEPIEESLPIPQLPEGLDDLPAEEQLKAHKEFSKQLRDGVVNAMKQEREALQQLVGPMAVEVGKMVKDRDKRAVMERFPNFDWEKHAPAMEQLRSELGWKMLPEEAAAAVAGISDPQSLLPKEPSVPHVETPRASTRAATGLPDSTPQIDRKAYEGKLTQAILHAHQTGNSVKAAEYEHALLKSRLGASPGSGIFGRKR